MNPPQVYMCSPSWALLPPPSPFHPSGSSQCTSPKHPLLQFYQLSFRAIKNKKYFILPLFITPVPLFLYLFIYLFILVALGLCWGAQLSPVAENGNTLQLQHVGFWLWWLLSLWGPGSIVAARGLTPWHVESSQTRDRTLVSCIGRRLLYQWATRETSLFLS